MTDQPFSKRFNINHKKNICDDFPSSARTALVYLIKDLFNRGYLIGTSEILLELNRTGRFTKQDLSQAQVSEYINRISIRINKLDWYQVYFFCERLYSKHLTKVEDQWGSILIDLPEVQEYFTNELNLILNEENLAFHFSNGQFHRGGRAQTQKSIERVGTVLSDPLLDRVRKHFLKAQGFFNTLPEPDLENCVKESLCSLEACVEVLTLKNASKEFEKAIRSIQGNKINQIPTPIGESIIKLHSYRGSGQGVSHASPRGYKVTISDAELVLSLVASFITYLYDLFPQEEEEPF